MSMFRLCQAYDEAAKLFDRQGSVETSRGLDQARLAITSSLRSLMDMYGAMGSIAVPIVGEMAYFNTWFALRGGWK
jgi:hypothetical protein